MANHELQSILDVLHEFNEDPTLHNLDEFVKITSHPQYKDLSKTFVKDDHFTNEIYKKFMDIVFTKLNSQVTDLMLKKLDQRLMG